MKSPITTLAALAVIIAAVFMIVYQFNDSIYDTIFSSVNLSQNVRRCKTLTWKISIPDKAATIQCMAFEPYFVKLLLADGKVWLLDRRKKQVVLMNPSKKTAKVTFIKDQPSDIYEALSNFKNMSQRSFEHIGQRNIGETQAIGFRVSFGHDQAIVWIDLQIRQPIRIEFLGMNESDRRKPAFIWSDIVFDVELDESLFRFDLEGYKVEEVDSAWDWQNYFPIASVESSATS